MGVGAGSYMGLALRCPPAQQPSCSVMMLQLCTALEGVGTTSRAALAGLYSNGFSLWYIVL